VGLGDLNKANGHMQRYEELSALEVEGGSQ